jgi:hypothetical protein
MDRIAKAMIDDAEAKGLIKPGSVTSNDQRQYVHRFMPLSRLHGLPVFLQS